MMDLSWLIWLTLLGLYLLPTIIACCRHCQNTVAIVVCNLLFGWTLVLWIGASVWALVEKQHMR